MLPPVSHEVSQSRPHLSFIINSFHCVPFYQRIQFKIFSLLRNCVIGSPLPQGLLEPSILIDLLILECIDEMRVVIKAWLFASVGCFVHVVVVVSEARLSSKPSWSSTGCPSDLGILLLLARLAGISYPNPVETVLIYRLISSASTCMKTQTYCLCFYRVFLSICS